MINEYFKIFFESYGDAVLLLKKNDFTVVDFNKKSLLLYEIPLEKRKELIGKPYTNFKLSEFSFLQPEEFNTIILEIKSKGKWSVVLPTKTINNKPFTVKTTFSLLNYDKEEYLLVITEKVTENTEEETKILLKKESIRAQLAEEANILLEKEVINHKNTQEFINSMINSSLDMILASDNNDKITHVSPSASYLFGYTKEEFNTIKPEILYKNIEEYELVREQIKKQGYFIGEITNKKKNGDLFNSYLSASPIQNKKGDIIGLMGVSRDIEEIKKIEKEIIDSEKRYRELFENLSDAIVIVDEKNNLIDINQIGKEIFEISNKKGVNIYSFVSDKYTSIIKEKSIELREKGTVKGLEVEIITNNGNKKMIEISSNAYYENEKFKGSRDIIRDITQKRKKDLLIIEQSSKIQSIFENSSNVIIWTLDTDFNITSANNEFLRAFREILGFDVEFGSNFFDIIKNKYKPHLLKPMGHFYEKAQTGEPQKFESILYDKNEQSVLFETFLSPIIIKGRNKYELACLAVDLTDKKEIEFELRNLIDEKEVLLKEVHHRVKNNLQVISSILNLQSSYVKDQNTLDILRESQNRIKSMSFIHESLYRSDDFSFVNFSGYITSLSHNLVQSYILEYGNIDLELSVGDINLNLDQAIPCGLIINELVSNAIKYAFPEGRKGIIKIELENKDNCLFFKVSDNGIGLPDNFDVENTETLGLQLVYTLISQLDGDIQVNNDNGTVFLFNFTIQNKF